VEQRRLSGAGRCDDQGTLAIADRCDEVDRAPDQLRATLRGAPRLEVELPLRVRRRERVELGSAKRRFRRTVVDRRDLDQCRAPARIPARRPRDQVALSQAMLPNQERRDVRVAGVGEVARLRAPHEAAVAGGVEPPLRLTRGDELYRLRVPGGPLALWVSLALIATTAAAVAASSSSILPILESAPFARGWRIAAVVRSGGWGGGKG
jgi:hypothetical protein